MEIDNGIVIKLQNIIDRLELVEGYDGGGRLECDSPATEEALCKTEYRLGITLPPSFRQVLKTIGRSLYFYYSLTDFIMPSEFSDIFSGGLSWDMEALKYVNEITGECADAEEDEEEKAYIQRISSMLQFAESGNGDIYALDMAAEGTEKPVLYWEHETCDITYLAGSFETYLDRIIELYAVGDEIWQMEGFLEADGLNPYSESARKWKQWFENFLNTRLETEKQDLNTLYSFTLVRKRLNHCLKEAYESYDKKDILQLIQEKLMEHNDTDTQRLLITMAADLVGNDAGPWTEELWESIAEYPHVTSTSLRMGKYSFSSVLLAYLSAHCMEKERAFHLVRDYLQRWAGSRLTGSQAFEHMKFFNRELVIPWMEQQNMISPYGWDALFMSVKPRWTDMLQWSEEANKKKVLIDGLTLYVKGKEGMLAPEELPHKQKVLNWLAELKEAETLNIRKRKIDKIVAEIDLLYQCDPATWKDTGLLT